MSTVTLPSVISPGRCHQPTSTILENKTTNNSINFPDELPVIERSNDNTNLETEIIEETINFDWANISVNTIQVNYNNCGEYNKKSYPQTLER